MSCCCYVTNHKCISLKQYSFINSQFYRPKGWHSTSKFSAQGLTGLKSKCRVGCILMWIRDPTPGLCACDRIQFLETIELKFLAGYQPVFSDPRVSLAMWLLPSSGKQWVISLASNRSHTSSLFQRASSLFTADMIR